MKVYTPFINYPRRLKGFLAKSPSFDDDGVCRFSIQLNDLIGSKQSDIALTLSDDKHCGIDRLVIDDILTITIHKSLPNGLMMFSVDSDLYWKETEHHVAKQVYVVLKHIFHEHTHHHKDDDMLLLPEKIESLEDKNVGGAISRIVDQYIEKIIYYHKRLRRSFWYSPRDASNILSEFNKALGEILYARHFITLNVKSLSEDFVQGNIQAFAAASSSFESMLTVFSARLNKKNIDIAYAVLLLTAAVYVFGGLAGVLNKIYMQHPKTYLCLFISGLFLLYGTYWLITREKSE